MKATEVTVGLAESNGSLLPGIWRDSLYVTCGLTACTPGSAPGPTLGNQCGKTFLPLNFSLPKRRAAEMSTPRAGRADVVDADSVHDVDVPASKLAASSTVLLLGRAASPPSSAHHPSFFCLILQSAFR